MKLSTPRLAHTLHVRSTQLPRLVCRGARRNRLRFDWLEDRTLLATFVVSNTNDSGPGTLRQAILDSNAATKQTNTIDFAIPGSGVKEISPISPLPAITQAVLIDGWSQPGFADTPLIQIDGGNAGISDGLLFTGSNVTVRGLDISDFAQGAGIHISGASATNNWLYGNFLGTDPSGTQPLPDQEGVKFDGGATQNLLGTNGDGVNDTAERNLLSGDLSAGVWITGRGTNDNALAGNWIGTDISGSVALSNGTQGVVDSFGDAITGGVAISAGASGNRIGTDGKSVDDVGERNVIANSNGDAIDIFDTGTESNVVAGNFIGTDVTGTKSLGVFWDGIYLAYGASSNWIGVNPSGGPAIQDEGNVISGNGNDGVDIWSSNDNVVAGNKIGTDVTGTVALGNSFNGVEVDVASDGNTIGGTASGAGNVISANGSLGVSITGAGATDNLVQGNRIGTDVTGTVALSNKQGCVSAPNNTVANNSTGGLTTGGGVFYRFDFASDTSAIDWTLRGDLSAPPHRQASGGSTAVYRIVMGEGCLLLAVVHPEGFTARLMILDSQGRLLVQSDGLSPSDPDPVIDQFLAGGNYSLVVESTGGVGAYSLTTALTPASAPLQPIPVGYYPAPEAIVAGDFTGDGRTDLAVANQSDNTVSVLLGNGDGTFQPQLTYAVGNGSDAIVAGDFTGDGQLDLAVVNPGTWPDFSGSVSVLLGNGDGTFRPQGTYAVGSDPVAIVAGDFTGDGHLDLAVVNDNYFGTGPGSVSVLLGNGDGTFQPQVTFAVGTYPRAIVAGDFTGDGRTDLAVANSSDNTVSVLLGNGDGTFQPQVTYAVGNWPDAIVAGDFTGDGHLDLAVTNEFDSTMSVLLGNGDGTFQPQVTYAVGSGPEAMVAGDFAGDGRTDLAVVANAGFVFGRYGGGGGTVSVLLGNGDGTFQPQVTYAVGNLPNAIVAGYFNGEGRMDLAVVNFSGGGGIRGGGTVSVLLGNGDGTFQPQVPAASAAVPGPGSVVAGDFTGNGRTDLAVADGVGNEVSILLANGDGTFQPPVTYAVGSYPDAIVASDFNGDGRIDLAVANAFSNTVSVLLGNGDGTFQPQVTYAVGNLPDAIVAGYFNGDGRMDLAVANASLGVGGGGTVSVLLGNGDGTFQPQVTYAVGDDPNAIVAADFTGDGHTDLAVTNLFSDTVSVLLGNGDGTFQPQVTYAVGGFPTGIVAGDFTGDGRTNLAVNGSSPMTGAGEVSVLLGNGDGTFQPQVTYAVGNGSYAIVAGNFTGDGRTDLAVTGAGSVSVLLGNGDGTFQPQGTYAVGSQPDAIVAGDFTGDGRTDLAVANLGDNTVSVLLGNGDGTFSAAAQFVTTPRATPLVADVNGDGTEDVLVINGAGDILYRQGVPGRPGTFEPPVTVNPGNPSRDIAWVTNPGQVPVLASVDAHDNVITLYSYENHGFVKAGSLATGPLPAQVITADLDANGLTDLVVRNAGDGTLSVFYGTAFDRTNFRPDQPQFVPPEFSLPVTIPSGLGVSDVRAVDLPRRGELDLVVTNKLTGQVGILQNLGDRTFGPLGPYRAGIGLSAIDPTGSPELTSLEATVGVAAGPLTPGGPTDLITLNSGSKTLGVLAGLAQGRFANPIGLYIGNPAQVIRMAHLTGNGTPALLLLGTDQVTIMLGDGHEGFQKPVSYHAGLEPTGLTVADINGDGIPDLLIGNTYGDLLILQGNGDGTFRPYREADQEVALAVADLTGNGKPDFIYADQSLDRVVVQYGTSQTRVLGDQATGLLAPGAVALADLTGNGIPDLIVANSGSNNVLVYPGLGNGQFGPALNGGHGFVVGTNPTAVTVASLNGQPDLIVADNGSNEVSILLGQGSGSNWTLVPGPRISTDGGPMAVAVGNILGDGKQDLAVANQQANNVQVFPGQGGGFFSQNATTYPVGQAPDGLFMGDFSGSGTQMAALNSGSNTVSVIDPRSGVTQTIPTGGVFPSSGFSGDFTNNGFTDLVVGNSASGQMALFTGGAGGLSLNQSITSAEVPSPTSLSFAGVSGGVLSFYAATAGREAASLLAFNLNEQQAASTGAVSGQALGATTLLSSGPVLAAATAGVFQQVSQLLGSGSSIFDLIAPLFTVSVIPGSTSFESSGEGGVTLLASFTPAITPGVPVGQSLSFDGHGTSGDTSEAKPGPEKPAGSAVVEEGPTLPLWARIAIGLERSFEQARSDLLKRAGVPENSGQAEQSRPEIRTKAEQAPAPPETGVPTRPTKTSFHTVIDGAIAELAAVGRMWWQLFPAESDSLDGPAAPVASPPRLIAPVGAAALASAAALVGKWSLERSRRRVGATHHYV
jgi:YVTN family beta-propeller protein